MIKWNFPIFRAIVGPGPVTCKGIFKLIVIGWGIKIIIFNIAVLAFGIEPFPFLRSIGVL
jgi:hypothetical protein